MFEILFYISNVDRTVEHEKNETFQIVQKKPQIYIDFIKIMVETKGKKNLLEKKLSYINQKLSQDFPKQKILKFERI